MTRECFSCEAPDVVDRHHVIPIEYGGPENGKTVDICPRCHRIVHECGKALCDTGKLPDKAKQLSENGLILVRYIARAKMEHEDSGKEKADTARNMVQISCTREELALFHSVKEQLGSKSLERAIKHAMIEYYQRQMRNRDEQPRKKNESRVPKSATANNTSKRRKVRNKGK